VSKYTPVHIRFLSKKIAGRRYKEVTRLFNERFGMSATETAIKTLLFKNGLRNNRGRGVPLEERRKYLPRHIQFLKGIVKGRSYDEITKIFNRQFGFTIGVKAMRSLVEKHNLKNGRDCRFRPGNVPFNKGQKGYCVPGSEKGWFKPGNMPFGTLPLGSERINIDGYVEVKYAEKSGPPKNRWKRKHVLIWEKMNGPAPKGHVIIFADGNRRNFNPENLVLVSRKELAVLNHGRLLASKNEEITKISVGIARLRVILANRKRGTLESRSKKKLVVIDDRGSRVVIACDQKTGRYLPARKTRSGLRRLRVLLKSRKTIEEAREDLIAYALKRGWRRV
jgi:hypothetical protein